jgi:hypothetical protein
MGRAEQKERGPSRLFAEIETPESQAELNAIKMITTEAFINKYRPVFDVFASTALHRNQKSRAEMANLHHPSKDNPHDTNRPISPKAPIPTRPTLPIVGLSHTQAQPVPVHPGQLQEEPKQQQPRCRCRRVRSQTSQSGQKSFNWRWTRYRPCRA